MAWHRPGDKSLSEPVMAKFTVAYMRHLASIGLQAHGASPAEISMP